MRKRQDVERTEEELIEAPQAKANREELVKESSSEENPAAPLFFDPRLFQRNQPKPKLDLEPLLFDLAFAQACIGNGFSRNKL